MVSELINIKRRNLPHWVIEGSTYFITTRVLRGELSVPEQIIILEHIKHGGGKFYDLCAAIVMPDHMHVILHPFEDISLSDIMKGIKGVSANKVNKLRNATGSLWQDESFDRIIRDAKELDEKLLYMFNNPIKAGLTKDTSTYHGWYVNEKLFR